MSCSVIRFISVVSLLCTISLGFADEKSDEAAKQKETAKANLEKMGVKTPTMIETADLIVCGSITDKEAKPIADLLQKQYTLAYKALKFDDKDKTIRGKFTVYCFSTKREYGTFARQIRQERPESSETSTYDVSGDDCFLALVVESSGSSVVDPEVAASIAVALLERKAGGSFLPPWVKIGFRKTITMRTDAKFGDATRKSIKGLVGKGKALGSSDAWNDDCADKLMVATSVVDYLTFGTTPPKIIDFIGGFRPSEDVPEPTVMRALMSAGLKEEELDKGWKNWVLKGK